MTQMVKPKFPAKAQQLPHGRDHDSTKATQGVRSTRSAKTSCGVQVTIVRKGHANVVPFSKIRSRGAGDGLLIVAEQQEAVEEAAAEAGPARARPDRQGPFSTRLHSDLCWKGRCGRIPAVTIAVASGFPVHLFVSSATTRISYYIRLGAGVWRPRRRADASRSQGGSPAVWDTVKSQLNSATFLLGSEWSWRLAGLIQFQSRVGTVTLGIGGGPLLSLLFSASCAVRFHALGHALATQYRAKEILGLAISWQPSASMLVNHLVRTVSETGLSIAIHRHGGPVDHGPHRSPCRLLPDEVPFDDLLGVSSCDGNPAVLVYSTRWLSMPERPDIGYAMIFPIDDDR